MAIRRSSEIGEVIVTDFKTKQLTSDHHGFAQRQIERLLAGSGVVLNGPNPWDIQVYNSNFYWHVLINGSLGLGEAYMNEWWDRQQIDETINLILRTSLAERQNFLGNFITWAQVKLFNLQKVSRAFQVGEQHYDIGNELYEVMLDERMVYTCGYWARADNLAEAQVDLATEYCRGLPVEIRLQDYRDVEDKFDAIVSLGMFEHVGHKNYRAYMEIVRKCLRHNARFLLHTIGKNDSRPGVDPWIAKYVFPNGETPSMRQISASLEPYMIVEDMHNFGPDYDRTLMVWFKNFDNAWTELQQNYPRKNYSERFYRMWKYYLHACAGGFKARHMQLWQIVISSGTNRNVYRRPE